MTQQSPYIPLPPVAKPGVIAGASLLWFYNVFFFTFAMPVALPALMQRYNTMAAYAMLGSVTALFSCLVTLSAESWGTASGGAESALSVRQSGWYSCWPAPSPPTARCFFFCLPSGIWPADC